MRSVILLALFVTTASLGLAAQESKTDDLRIKSPAFSSQGAIPKRFSCQGAGVSPPLTWEGVPQNARSLALVVTDPDAPSGLWVHWLIYNLPTNAHGLPEGVDTKSLPAPAKVGRNSYKKQAYGGVCPPSGQHHYIFTLYAIDTRLNLSGGDRAALLRAMRGHIITTAKLVGTYKKQ